MPWQDELRAQELAKRNRELNPKRDLVAGGRQLTSAQIQREAQQAEFSAITSGPLSAATFYFTGDVNLAGIAGGIEQMGGALAAPRSVSRRSAPPRRSNQGSETTSISLDRRVDVLAELGSLARTLGVLKPKNRPASVSAGYNIDTGRIAVGCSGGGRCAEPRVVEKLGGDATRNRFVGALRPRAAPTPLREVPVCIGCGLRYPRESFPIGTLFQTDSYKPAIGTHVLHTYRH